MTPLTLYLDTYTSKTVGVRCDFNMTSYYIFTDSEQYRPDKVLKLPSEVYNNFSQIILHSEPISNMFINDLQLTTVELEYFEMVYGKDIKDSLLVLLDYLHKQNIVEHRNQQPLI